MQIGDISGPGERSQRVGVTEVKWGSMVPLKGILTKNKHGDYSFTKRKEDQHRLQHG